MKPDGRGVTIVGDEAQAIYSFRAANVDNILGFPTNFTPAARVIKLQRNYRSTTPNLRASNAVINLSPLGFGKQLTAMSKGGKRPRLMSVMDAAEEAAFVAEEIQTKQEQGRSLKNIAVLFGASGHSDALEIELARRGIVFKKFGGSTFANAAHVKDVLAILRWAENPADMLAGLRALGLLDGVGPANPQAVRQLVT